MEYQTITGACKSGGSITTTNNELVSEVIDADDCCYADERDKCQKHLEAYEGRQLRAQVLVA